MKRNTRLLLAGLMVLLLASALIAPVTAHRAYVGAFLTGDQYDEVLVRAWYEGGSPMAGAEITIYAIRDGTEEIYIQDTADEQGFYAFDPEWRVTEYTIIAEHTGHRATMTLDLASGITAGPGTELPVAARIIAGFGYLAGLAGIAMIYSAQKMQKEHRE
ncbi:MAG: hypothetical protein D5R99_07970 [Methanocalculus sp. MSAO_Arc1]|uniref:hypothetical protein n=1 Tax=Methanocalculus TaxID=71151 RepID=UPI000FF6A26A|nr:MULTISPECIES: hypothetical protein [unclassified Methanocalculus]MCP1662405.1 nickel transport protein [Methanocalculus sp. AMF5]RQD79470.1 MAG: hypothetical protein D5R99_07970 [Methanocalculus sp. MSAO_Arc1]